jgi:hypothetical protein
LNGPAHSDGAAIASKKAVELNSRVPVPNKKQKQESLENPLISST